MGLINIKPSTYTYTGVETMKDPIAETKKRTRKKKLSTGEQITGRVDKEPVPLIKTEVPYITSYQKTQEMLEDTIKELDLASQEIRDDIKSIRDSKTMKSKYTYLANMQSARATLLGQRITAIREMNNSISKAHDFDAKRDKEYRAQRMNEQDDVSAIEKIYDAFVNTPVGRAENGKLINPLQVNTQNLTLSNPGMLTSMIGLPDPQQQLNSFVNNMTEEQAMMFVEDNPAIEEVIIYNPTNGAMQFSYYDKNLNQPVTMVRAKDISMFIDGINMDFDTLSAYSKDLGESYRIILDNNLATGFTSRADLETTEPVDTGVAGDGGNMEGF